MARPNRSRIRTAVRWLLAIPCVLLVGYLLFRLKVGADYRAEVAKARAAGLWTDPRDFTVKPPIPEDENAGPKLTALSEAIKRHHPMDGKYLENALKGPTQEAEFLAAVRVAEPYLAAYRQAAKLPRCDFKRDWSQAGVLFLEYTELSWAIRVAAKLAIIKAKHGDPAGGLNLLAEYAPLAADVGADPILDGKGWQYSRDRTCLIAVNSILGTHGREPGVPEAAARVIAALGPELDMAHARAGECAFDLVLSRGLLTENDVLAPSEVEGLPRPPHLLISDPGVQQLWATELLKNFEKMNAAATSSPDYAARELNELNTRAEILSDHSFSNTLLRELNHISPDIAVPDFETGTEDLTLRRAVRQEIAALQSWNKTGRKPTHLLLGLPEALNPLTSGTFTYKVTPAGFKILGVALDGIDQRGKPNQGSTAPDSVDNSIGYPAPSPLASRTK